MHDGQFSVQVLRGVAVVAAHGDIDITNAAELESALLEAAARGYGTVVADLTRAQFCDASGLRTLLAARQRATAAGGEMLLVSRGPGMLRILAITCADQAIPSFTSLAEALAQSPASRSNGHRPDGTLPGQPPPDGLKRDLAGQ
jgi:anti-sigma B factor antagonist